MDSNGPGSNGPDRAEERRVMARELLERIADKWTLLVIDALEEGDGDMRFGQIREKVGKISQKMLTRTLRQLERDGLVVRTVRPVIPPHVDYRLTPLGLSLAESVCGVWMWVDAHMTDVQQARRAFDESPPANASPTATPRDTP
jgi:DNA-binding HxlR family transcriptional regulator